MTERPLQPQLESMSVFELFDGMLDDGSWASLYEKEILKRKSRGRHRNCEELCRDALKNGKPKPQQQEMHLPPWDSSEDHRESWGSDKKLAEDFKFACETYARDLKLFWDPHNQIKDLDEAEDFLESIEDYDEYDDLSDKQKGFLGVIRRTHHEWVKAGRPKIK